MAETSFLTPEMIVLLTTIISFVIGVLSKTPAYQKVKSKMNQSKDFIVAVDDALYDETVTDEEFRKMFDTGKKLIDRE